MLMLWNPPYKHCPFSWSVRLALHEKRVAYDETTIAEAHDPDTFRRLNPRDTMPAIQDGSCVVYETVAILEYLDHVLDGVELMPSGRGRATALARLHEAGTFLTPASREVGLMLLRKKNKSEPQAFRLALDTLLQELDRLEHQLGAPGPWLAGPEVTLVDLAVFPHVAYFVGWGLEIHKRHPRLWKWHEALAKRPAFESAAPPPIKKMIDAFLPPSKPLAPKPPARLAAL